MVGMVLLRSHFVSLLREKQNRAAKSLSQVKTMSLLLSLKIGAIFEVFAISFAGVWLPIYLPKDTISDKWWSLIRMFAAGVVVTVGMASIDRFSMCFHSLNIV